MSAIRRCLPLVGLVPLLIGVGSCRQAGSGSLPANIISVRVGIPPGPLVGDEEATRRSEPMFKAGHWTPVLVTIEGKGRLDGADLVVQTVDSDDVLNEYAVKLPAIEFSAEQPSYTVMTYARPGKLDSPITVSLRSKGQSVTVPERSANALEPTHFLYVTLGARVTGLRLPGLDEKSMRRSEIGAIDRASELPTRWQGYQTVDLAILITSNDEFMSALLNDPDRRGALVEWVRRGGKLVLCVGKNQGLLQNREDLKDFLPVDFTGTQTAGSASLGVANFRDDLTDASGKSPLLIAKMTPKPDRGVRAKVGVAKIGNDTQLPLVVQASYGLGRVTVVAVDPDQPPFSRWKSVGTFWQRLLQEAGPQYAESKEEANFNLSDSGDDLLRQVQLSLQKYDDVPVISFGWVALFILIYIIVVGPLDYLFLKKVVKRLELTWVTFPLVVLAVSAGAYFTADALKGSDQKVNKLDLIDVDLHTQTAQGTTWFSIFSPRVQNYTIGVEPAEGWGFSKDPAALPIVTWMGQANSKRQSLFRRSYDYDTSLGGLNRVPIQVWANKEFSGTWYHRLDPAAPPLTVDLEEAKGGSEVSGKITSHLPVALENVSLLYRNKVYQLGTLKPGDENRRFVTSSIAFSDWARQNPAVPVPQNVQPRTPWAPKPLPPAIERTGNIIRSIMFHEAFESGGSRTARNAGFRELDQSWRIGAEDRDGAVLYGQLPMVSGAAEDVLNRNTTVTRLRLGALPGSGQQRPPMQGTLRQETHLRFFVPVKVEKK